MTSKLTRERIELIANFHRAMTLPPSHAEIEELARMALAAMDSEPVVQPVMFIDGDISSDDADKLAKIIREFNEEDERPLAKMARIIRENPHPINECDMPKAQPAPASETITVTDDMAYAFHHALTDSMLGADDVEEIKTGLRAVFANLTAPIVSAEYPERLPCSVLLEPGLRFGKGIKTSTILAALARRAVYESDMAALTPEEKAEFREKIADFKALIAQPAPVVPEDVLDALQKVARIRLDLNDFDGDRRGIADCLGDAEEALIEVVNRRAAMLQAVNSPAHSGLRPEQSNGSPAQDGSSPEQNTIDHGYRPECECSGCKTTARICAELAGNSPVIPDGYVMVPKEPTAEMIWAAKYCFTSTPGCDVFKSAYIAMLATARRRYRNQVKDTRTPSLLTWHFMPVNQLAIPILITGLNFKD